MREILFRGKKKDNGEWIEGFFVQQKDKCYICANPYQLMDGYSSKNGQHYGFGDFYEVEQETIGQYAELKDKCRKGIFEGDILSFTQKGQNAKGVVSVVDGCFFAIIEGQKCWLSEGIKRYKGRIVGNIFDNPELLKEETENANPAN